jgi:hypothetical protein
MKAHQRVIREHREASGADAEFNLFGNWWETIDKSLDKSDVRPINFTTAASFVEKYEWLEVMPAVGLHALGHFFSGHLGGMCILGDTGSPVAFTKMLPTAKVISLQRGIHLWWTPPNSASYFTARVCRWLKENTDYNVITATCDIEAGEIGTIYQALNWKYTGDVLEKGRPHFFVNGRLIHPKSLYNKHGTSSVEKIKAIYGDRLTLKERQIKYRYMHALYRSIKIKGLPYPKRAEQVSSSDTVGTPDKARGSS